MTQIDRKSPREVADEHVASAKSLLAQADRARNADNWTGNRAADSLALGTTAQAHVTLELVITIGARSASTT
jgi:hypothetical protein